MIDVGDVTGDGRSDIVRFMPLGEGRPFQLAVGDGASGIAVELHEEYGHLLRILGVDLDEDGWLDLLVGDLWASELCVFRGPLEGARTWEGCELRFAVPHAPQGLANLFSSSFVVADLDGDGATDILVTAPAEGEEACLGQEPPRLFPGPFDRAVYGASDATLTLAGPERACLGEVARCASGAVELLDARRDCYRYPLPLSSAEPGPC